MNEKILIGILRCTAEIISPLPRKKTLFILYILQGIKSGGKKHCFGNHDYRKVARNDLFEVMVPNLSKNNHLILLDSTACAIFAIKASHVSRISVVRNEMCAFKDQGPIGMGSPQRYED